MSIKTVFISSTYKDLQEHRRTVWNTLKRFDVTVRGMEKFGARTTGPLETCLAEVEQCDFYVGIIAYRLGSLDPVNNKPYTILEYESAVQGRKEILIYLANDEAACFPQSVVDDATQAREELAAFKRKLRELHTVSFFSTPEDLAEKLSSDFQKYFSPKQGRDQSKNKEDEFAQTAQALDEFRLTPKRYNGDEVRLRVSFRGDPFPASRKLCDAFNLSYGFTIGAAMSIVKPGGKGTDFGEVYATGNNVDALRTLTQIKEADLYAQLRFSEENVSDVRARFSGSTYSHVLIKRDSTTTDVPPEGKVMLLFTKPG